MVFDRLWSIFVNVSVRFKRNKRNLTILIVLVYGFVAMPSIFYFWYGDIIVSYPQLINGTYKFRNLIVCSSYNYYYLLAQDVIFNLLKSIIPAALMFSLSFVLIIKLRKLRRRISTSTESRIQQKNENRFTMAVFLINIFFLVLNIPYVVYFIITYYINISGVYQSPSQNINFLLYEKIAFLLSYMFTLLEFWRDLCLNRIFREEIYKFIRNIVGIVKTRLGIFISCCRL